MFTELLQAEVWRKKLESAGYRVVNEAWERDRVPTQPHEGREPGARATSPEALRRR